MTRLFQTDGQAVPVTAISVGPCFVTDIKTFDRDGYTAIQIGFGKAKHVTKPLDGHLKGKNFKHIKEFRIDSVDTIETGSKIDVSTFAVGDSVKVVGTSKGKGFQGVVKRHGFHGSPASHGHKDQLRMPGSIGATDAARVLKGLRMGGHMGNDQVTVANLEVVDIDQENNILFLKGAVPGARNSLVYIKADGDLVFAVDKVNETKSELQAEDIKTEVIVEEEKEEKNEPVDVQDVASEEDNKENK